MVVNIEGKFFVFDTGSNVNILHSKSNLVVKTKKTLELSGFTGSKKVPITEAFHLGGFKFASLVALNLKHLSEHTKLDIEGVIGVPFLKDNKIKDLYVCRKRLR